MDFELSDTQATLHAEALALARQFSLDYWLEHDANSEYPWDFIRTFADHGWLATMIPEEYGGAGLGITEAALLLHAICLLGGRDQRRLRDPLLHVPAGADHPLRLRGDEAGVSAAHGARRDHDGLRDHRAERRL